MRVALGVGDRDRPAAEAGAAVAAGRHRVEPLDRLVAAGRRVRERVDPVRDALADPRDDVVQGRRAADEEGEAAEDVREPRRRDVEHREEDPEVEEPAAEVLRLEEDEHRRAPDHEQRPEVLQPALRQHLALLAQVAGEEDDQRELGELAGLEPERSRMHPKPRAVDRLPDQGQRREREQQRQREQSEATRHGKIRSILRQSFWATAHLAVQSGA